MTDFKGNLHNNYTKNESEITVKKWVDYSSKYGLGYVLSNGIFGVFFNDSSKIIYIANNDDKFQYIVRCPDKSEKIKEYNVKHYP